jgi:hypothetical protein
VLSGSGLDGNCPFCAPFFLNLAPSEVHQYQRRVLILYMILFLVSPFNSQLALPTLSNGLKTAGACLPRRLELTNHRGQSRHFSIISDHQLAQAGVRRSLLALRPPNTACPPASSQLSSLRHGFFAGLASLCNFTHVQELATLVQASDSIRSSCFRVRGCSYRATRFGRNSCRT